MGFPRLGGHRRLAVLALLSAAGLAAEALTGVGRLDARHPAGPPSATGAGGSSESVARVDHVVDGDTLDVRLDGRFVRVRTVQIDAPESSSTRFGRPDRCGPPATAYAKTLTRPGASVWLELSGRDRYDTYGRLLALVHLGGPGGETWQERMVRAGWAEVLVYRGNTTRLLGVLESDQRYARTRDLGVYARCDGRFHDAGG
jgi:endonuclease YncB( thermonuclease family)